MHLDKDKTNDKTVSSHSSVEIFSDHRNRKQMNKQMTTTLNKAFYCLNITNVRQIDEI